ncbi:MAG TPA: GNAT family N-acetyltransferase [Chloroflexota bacterium]|nr:GNAT family N-acetyltransferase [Chloroflexota bacterium]
MDQDKTGGPKAPTPAGATAEREPDSDRIADSLHHLHFRSIRRDDWHRLQEFHKRLSGLTVELRFHGAKRELSTPLAHDFADVDGHDRVAILATTGTRGRIVGVARYNRIAPALAEVAFVVEDAYQGHGIGRRLMERLKAAALENGITQFVAEILPGNVPMFGLLKSVGPVRSHFEGGECEVYVDLVAPS